MATNRKVAKYALYRYTETVQDRDVVAVGHAGDDSETTLEAFREAV